MTIRVVTLPASALREYATVPIGFLATHRLVPTAGGLPSLDRIEALPEPFVKDFDRLPGVSPAEWSSRFRLAGWGLFAARHGDAIAGGAAVAPSTEAGLIDDAPAGAAVLWDLRVAPAARGQHVGTALFRAAAEWAANRGHDALVVESQDINVAACRFYHAMGCRLMTYDPVAYPDLPGEARLLWRYDLRSATT